MTFEVVRLLFFFWGEVLILEALVLDIPISGGSCLIEFMSWLNYKHILWHIYDNKFRAICRTLMTQMSTLYPKTKGNHLLWSYGWLICRFCSKECGSHVHQFQIKLKSINRYAKDVFTFCVCMYHICKH
jgi:hypothetical protein